jgi:hypothetical protein
MPARSRATGRRSPIARTVPAGTLACIAMLVSAQNISLGTAASFDVPALLTALLAVAALAAIRLRRTVRTRRHA